MRRVSRVKRVEVACQYLLGKNCRKIKEETGVSHGSIVNIIKELEKGQLNIEGVSLEQVDDLRQLGVELRSSGLKPAQAMNGISFYQRLVALGITPEDLDCWSNLVREIRNADFQPRDFIEAAKRLIDLEKSQGKTFEALVDEYQKYQGEAERLGEEIGSLKQSKKVLSDLTERLSKELEELKKQKEILGNQVDIETGKLQELKSNLAEAAKEKSFLQQETTRLQSRRVNISLEIDGREETLRNLNQIGFSSEDLLRFKGFLNRISKSSNGSLSQVKEDFLSTLVSYKDILGLKKMHELELKKVKELTKQKSMLTGSIAQLESNKAMLQGEIDRSIAATMEKIKEFGEESALQLGQQLEVIKKQYDTLLADTLTTGEAVGKMENMTRRGELGQKGLQNFISEVKNRLGGNLS